MRRRYAGIRGGTREETFLGEQVVVGGDVVVAIDGRPVTDADTLVRIVTSELRPGATTTLSIVRDGRRRRITLTLAARSAR